MRSGYGGRFFHGLSQRGFTPLSVSSGFGGTVVRVLSIVLVVLVCVQPFANKLCRKSAQLATPSQIGVRWIWLQERTLPLEPCGGKHAPSAPRIRNPLIDWASGLVELCGQPWVRSMDPRDQAMELSELAAHATSHGVQRFRLASRAGRLRMLTHRVSLLEEYLIIMRAIASYAQVTSGFYDYRPGRLHSGYDIGLDAGTQVPSGWAGVVTQIEHWGGCEYAITVKSENGVSVAYGHLSPMVEVGQQVQTGSIIGTVAYDHVDIKMMDACGTYVDFAKENPFLGSPSMAHLEHQAAAY